jgi:hypothetical protein
VLACPWLNDTPAGVPCKDYLEFELKINSAGFGLSGMVIAGKIVAHEL